MPKFPSLAWPCAILCLLVCLCGCEIGFLGEAAVGADAAAALEGVESAGFAADGALLDEQALIRDGGSGSAATVRVAADWGAGRAAAAELNSTLVSNAETLAARSMGAEPLEGIVEHFDMEHKYLGKTVLTERGGVTFDARGLETGYLKRFAARTNLWDVNQKFRGSTEVAGDVTLIKNDLQEIQGFSRRSGVTIRTFDQANKQVGYSTVHPLTQRVFNAVPVILGGGFAGASSPSGIRTPAPHRGPHLIVSNAHFEYYNCCMLKAVYRLRNAEDSVPFRTGFAPFAHPYVGTTDNQITGTGVQMYTASGGMSIELDPGQETTVVLQLPVPAPELGGAERLPTQQLNSYSCRIMRRDFPSWTGFVFGNATLDLRLPC